MSDLSVGIAAFDITPEIHPEFGAWGTTPQLRTIDQPLLGRCIALANGDRKLLWFGLDLCGEAVPGTDVFRDTVAEAVGLSRDQIVWSTSQTHSSPTVPGSNVPGGSGITRRGQFDPDYCAAQRAALLNAFCQAARTALDRLQPATMHVGSGHCDTISYNTRFPMPTGGAKFSRHHAEGLQSGKFYDPTIGLVRFDDSRGRPLGAIFNFCAHPATMINDTMVSSDWVGTARDCIEAAIDGAPAMFVQGFCGDVNCRHIFGTPEQARRSGHRLGRAAAAAMPHLVPMRATPFDVRWKTIRLPCQAMPTRAELEAEIAARQAYVGELAEDPRATWLCGINLPEQMPPEQRASVMRVQLDYFEEGLRMLDAGERARPELDFTLGALRLGDMAAVLSPGENFTLTGLRMRLRSPFLHTLICGDTNGLFGYIGDDAEIDRGGYETDSYWKMLYIDGFRTALAKGTVDRIMAAADELLGALRGV